MDENAGVRKLQIVALPPYPHGDAQASRETEVQHGAIPDADSRAGVRRVEDGLHLFNREVSAQARIGFFGRKSQNPPDLLQSRRYPIFHEVHKGFDGS